MALIPVAKGAAEQFKEEGNESLKAKDFETALARYAECIAVAEDSLAGKDGPGGQKLLLSQLHANRAHVLLLLQRPLDAINECHKALTHDPQNSKASWRGTKAALSLGEQETAADFCRNGIMADRGNGTKALEQLLGESVGVWQLASGPGCVARQFAVGLAYLKGAGVVKDQKRCLEFWRKAAEHGDPMAERAVEEVRLKCDQEIARQSGKPFVHSTKTELIELWEKTATQGDVAAQFNLGLAYLKGDGVVRSNERCIELWTMAAKQGDVQAQKNLCALYADSRRSEKREPDLQDDT